MNVFSLALYQTFKSIKTHPERIAKADRNMVNDLDYADIKFPVTKKDFCKIEQKSNICVNIVPCGNNLFYPVHISGHKFEDCMDLLLIADETKSHYVYIKDYNKFMCDKTKNKNKKTLF